MVVLSDPLQWLLLTAVTAEICQSCPRITTGTMPTGWKKKKIKIKMQAVCTPPGKHTTQRTLTENIQPDLGPRHSHRHKPRRITRPRSRKSFSFYTQSSKETETQSRPLFPPAPPRLPLTPCQCVPSLTWRDRVRGVGAQI